MRRPLERHRQVKWILRKTCPADADRASPPRGAGARDAHAFRNLQESPIPPAATEFKQELAVGIIALYRTPHVVETQATRQPRASAFRLTKLNSRLATSHHAFGSQPPQYWHFVENRGALDARSRCTQRFFQYGEPASGRGRMLSACAFGTISPCPPRHRYRAPMRPQRYADDRDA